MSSLTPQLGIRNGTTKLVINTRTFMEGTLILDKGWSPLIPVHRLLNTLSHQDSVFIHLPTIKGNTIPG